jgi:hypothetical protein
MLSMFYELNPVIAEENFIIPVYEKNKSDLERLLRITNPLEFLSKLGYAANAVVSLYGVQANRNKQNEQTPYFITTFGNETPLEKLSDIISIMFEHRFRKETKLRKDTSGHEALHDINKEIVSLAQKYSSEKKRRPVRISFDYASLVMSIWYSDESKKIPYTTDELYPWDVFFRSIATEIKRKMVFTKRIYDEISNKAKSKRIPIEKLLGAG